MLQPTDNHVETLAGSSWQAIKDFARTYGAENGMDFDACISGNEVGFVCTNVLINARYVETQTAMYTEQEALTFLYAHCVTMLAVYRPTNHRCKRISDAYTLILRKIVPTDYRPVEPATLYARLRDLRKQCSSDDGTAMSVYTHALSLMQQGRKNPRRNARIKAETIIMEAFHELSRLLALRPTPALLKLDEMRRQAWLIVLLACLPGPVCKSTKIDKKIA